MGLAGIFAIASTKKEGKVSEVMRLTAQKVLIPVCITRGVGRFQEGTEAFIFASPFDTIIVDQAPFALLSVVAKNKTDGERRVSVREKIHEAKKRVPKLVFVSVVCNITPCITFRSAFGLISLFEGNEGSSSPLLTSP